MKSFTGKSRLKQSLVLITTLYVTFALFFSGNEGGRSLQGRGLNRGLDNGQKDILVVVMGQKTSFPGWVTMLGEIDASLTLLYGSYDGLPDAHEYENKFDLPFQAPYIPQTTWTQARNLLAGEAIRMEVRRGKQFDYWLFLDDDVQVICVGDDEHPEKVEAILGTGSCWQKVFNFMSSDNVPEHASTIYVGGQTGYSSSSTTDAMFAAFKRSHVPYLLPYASLPEGASQWTSQAALFCIMKTCMRQSTVLIPYIGAKNGAHREYNRGLNMGEILSVIKENYHNEEAGFKPCDQGLTIRQMEEYIGPFDTKEELDALIPPTDFEMCDPMKTRFEEWEHEIVTHLESREGVRPPPFLSSFMNTARNTDILVIVMGEKKAFPMWLERLLSINGSLSLLFGSFDEQISEDACENANDLECQVAFIPGTTWTEGRNLLAGEALRKEARRGKKYDYWLFLDDDVDSYCVGGEPMEQLLGEGSCWQKIFNFIASDNVPENASTVALPRGDGIPGFNSFSTTDAMFAAFKRDRVPYLLPYASMPEGSSEWSSQASLFCVMQTCQRSSAVLVPYVGGINPSLQRPFIRGYDLTQIRQTIAENYHDEASSFYPCAELSSHQVMQGVGNSGLFQTAEELNQVIPAPEFELCEPLKNRFDVWESEQLASSEPLVVYTPPVKETEPLSQPVVEYTISNENVDVLVMVMGEAQLFPTWKGRVGEARAISFLYGSFDSEIPSADCDNDFGLDCQTIFIPDTTWTQGRNLLAAEALRKERRRGKEYDYWVFLDDDVMTHCGGGEPMEELLGVGNCWQKVFNFIRSDHVPENVSTVTLPYGGNGMPGFASYSNTDAMVAAFKRERVPYLLPYVTIREGGSEWMSQAAIFCAMDTCMKSSALLVPYVGGRNAAHREYIRGLNLNEIRGTIFSNFDDDEADFHPCRNFGHADIVQGKDYSGTFESGAELNDNIPPPQLELCAPMKRRFDEWASQIV